MRYFPQHDLGNKKNSFHFVLDNLLKYKNIFTIYSCGTNFAEHLLNNRRLTSIFINTPKNIQLIKLSEFKNTFSWTRFVHSACIWDIFSKHGLFVCLSRIGWRRDSFFGKGEFWCNCERIRATCNRWDKIFFKRVTIANPDAVKLLITNYGDIDLVSEFLKSHVDDIIEKPFSFEMLLKILAEHIERKKLRSNLKLQD